MITTNVWSVERLPDEQLGAELSAAASCLKHGGLIAFPTETVYGLGADARNSAAVERIFSAKGRPSDNPLIVHIADRIQLDALVLPYPELASVLMDSFWPGPLTIVLPVRTNVLSPLVTAGLSTIGVRMPNHRAALALLEQAGCPVAAPSANRSGRPSPTLASHVMEDLAGRIDGLVDDGATGVGLESTVIELVGEQLIRILRPGGITREALQAAAPDASIDSASDQELDSAPRSPGMKYTHYAPQGELVLVQGEPANVAAYIQEQVDRAARNGERTGVLAFEERLAQYNADRVLSLGSEVELNDAAHRLYAALRTFDESGAQRIWSESSSEQGIGAALMNRLAKAAGNRVVRV
ncbi:L-threonylcarbamoyladenylate synthase [Paenibacillus sinopodophylli]|uniref:L-threonylcarbamoyladenylate synthase n=1 Tax=Paenibacillus sinopodophylli TaxID=1837342 RepID=UPI00110CE38C|nr:L-threonylcarbamoyladenylate synthase [Paenibacillus sinopodophylli]